MRIIRQKSRRSRDVDPKQINREIIRKVRRIDNGHRNSAISIHICAHIHLLDTRLRIDAHSARSREAEIRRKSPQASRDEVVVVLQPDERVVASGILRAPPVRVA